MTFNLQYRKFHFCSRLLISNDFLPRNGKTKLNLFFGTIQILERFINNLCKYIVMQRSTRFLGYVLL